MDKEKLNQRIKKLYEPKDWDGSTLNKNTSDLPGVWVAVKDRLPYMNQKVLCFDPAPPPPGIIPQRYFVGNWHGPVWDGSFLCYNQKGRLAFETYSVTHWMPLPPAP